MKLPGLEKVNIDAVYIYALVDPLSDEIKYIGKTPSVLMRYRQHVASASPLKDDLRANIFVRRWIRRLTEQNLRPDLVILEETDQAHSSQREQHWIGYIGINNLFNRNNGSRGKAHSSICPLCRQKTIGEHKKALDMDIINAK